ncbi:PstS family phosphate ABC transporter substrate-binding protein [Saccharopolyspora sp. NPDC002376]
MGVTWGDAVVALASLFGEHVGSWVLGVLAAVTISAPFVDRFFVRRKRIHYRVLYNSKIGLSPVQLHDGEVEPAHEDLTPIAKLVDRMSIVVIRVRNTGSFDIEAKDFAEDISFNFGERIVWDARISEAPTQAIRQRIRNNLVFLPEEQDVGLPEGKPAGEAGLGVLRAWLGRRFETYVQAQPTGSAEVGPQWHGVRLSKLNMERGQKFKLVVVLREPDDEPANAVGDDFATSKEISFAGSISNGRITDEKQQRRVTWPLITTAVGLLLAGALVTTLLTGVSATAGGIACASGELQVKGSSAFAPIVGTVAAKYDETCQTDIRVTPTGSLGGLRELKQTNEPDKLAVLSDGPAKDANDYVGRPVAVVVYALVVNESVDVPDLSTDDLRKIFSGEHTDWKQVRGGGESLPINIVGRGAESGSRTVFEQKVLGGQEPPLSSDGCAKPDRQGSTTPTRCERTETQDAIAAIAATPGAIGYADAPAVRRAIAENRPLHIVTLDGKAPTVDDALRGYPFRTVEYLYTKGEPADDTLLKRFTTYLNSDAGQAVMHDRGYTPCTGPNGPHPLCSPQP